MTIEPNDNEGGVTRVNQKHVQAHWKAIQSKDKWGP